MKRRSTPERPVCRSASCLCWLRPFPSRALPLPPASATMQKSNSLQMLEQRHAAFLELHESPSRRKFQLEFSQGIGLGNPASSSENIILGKGHVYKPPPPKSFASVKKDDSKNTGARLETTNQLAFRGYGEVASFKPEIKHRIMKADDHDFVEQMFLLWNVHGKKGSGLL